MANRPLTGNAIMIPSSTELMCCRFGFGNESDKEWTHGMLSQIGANELFPCWAAIVHHKIGITVDACHRNTKICLIERHNDTVRSKKHIDVHRVGLQSRNVLDHSSYILTFLGVQPHNLTFETSFPTSLLYKHETPITSPFPIINTYCN